MVSLGFSICNIMSSENRDDIGSDWFSLNPFLPERSRRLWKHECQFSITSLAYSIVQFPVTHSAFISYTMILDMVSVCLNVDLWLFSSFLLGEDLYSYTGAYRQGFPSSSVWEKIILWATGLGGLLDNTVHVCIKLPGL